MWFFMYSCYISSLITLIFLITAFFQSFSNFLIFQANHVTFIILTSIVYLFSETLVIFFFVGTGVSVKEYTQDNNLEQTFRQRSIALKQKMYPPLLLNMLFMMIAFILVGAVDTHRMPAWGYQLLLLGATIHYVKIKIKQNDYFKDMTNIVLEMSGVSKAQ